MEDGELKYRPVRYVCPRCKWDFAKRKKRCCPGCGTLLLIASDVPTDAELTALKRFWMWDPDKEKWNFIADWEEHKREALGKLEKYATGKGISGETDKMLHPNGPWIQ